MTTLTKAEQRLADALAEGARLRQLRSGHKTVYVEFPYAEGGVRDFETREAIVLSLRQKQKAAS